MPTDLPTSLPTMVDAKTACGKVFYRPTDLARAYARTGEISPLAPAHSEAFGLFRSVRSVRSVECLAARHFGSTDLRREVGKVGRASAHVTERHARRSALLSLGTASRASRPLLGLAWASWLDCGGVS